MTAPVINAAALAANVTNEGGVAGTYRLLNRYAILKALDLTARVQNVLNESYAEVRGFPALGVQALVGLRASF